jgi:hypothetical protein
MALLAFGYSNNKTFEDQVTSRIKAACASLNVAAPDAGTISAAGDQIGYNLGDVPSVVSVALGYALARTTKGNSM